MIFRLIFDTPSDATAFTEWAQEAGHAVTDTADRDGCPYRRGRILEAVVTDDQVGDFATTWREFIASFGVR